MERRIVEETKKACRDQIVRTHHGALATKYAVKQAKENFHLQVENTKYSGSPDIWKAIKYGLRVAKKRILDRQRHLRDGL